MKYYLKFEHFSVKADQGELEAYDDAPDVEELRQIIQNSGAHIESFTQEDRPHLEDWRMTIECSPRQWRQIQLFLDPKIWYTSQEDDDLREEQWEIQEEYCERKYANWKPKPPETDPTKLKQFLARFV